MALTPRSLPPLHKNQLHVPVKCIGFSSDQPSPPASFFRNHEIRRKKLPAKPSGPSPPSDLLTPDDHDDHDDRDQETMPSTSKESMTSLIHIRGRASLADVTESVSVADVARKSPTSEGDHDNDDGDDHAKLASFLTEDPTSDRSYDGRSPAFSPLLECSKYNIIGEPRFRKKRVRRSVWTLPKIVPRRGFVPPDDADHPKTNSIDLRSIYGTKSKVQQVS